jgi:hypothetical protein
MCRKNDLPVRSHLPALHAASTNSILAEERKMTPDDCAARLVQKRKRG